MYNISGKCILNSAFQSKVFHHGKDIPKRFIKRGVNFQGQVKEISTDGKIYVQHLPILDLRLPWLRTQRTDMLPLTLAFVELNSASRKWLECNLSNKEIWFKVLRVEDDGNILQSTVYQQKVQFIICKIQEEN